MKITSLLVLKCSGDSPFRLLPARRRQGVHPLRRPHRRQAHPARATPIGSARWYLPLKFDPFNPAASLSAVSSFSLSSFSSSPAPAMGGSRTQVNKPHKTRFASEASRHAHKISVSEKSRIAKPDAHRPAVKGARAARIQRNKSVRDQKRAALLNEKRASNGLASPPRVVGIGLEQCISNLLTVI